jgi:thioesterase domain-containing protein
LAAEVDVHFVPGQHHSMVKEPHVQELARTLDASLRQVEAGGVAIPQNH